MKTMISEQKDNMYILDLRYTDPSRRNNIIQMWLNDIKIIENRPIVATYHPHNIDYISRKCTICGMRQCEIDANRIPCNSTTSQI